MLAQFLVLCAEIHKCNGLNPPSHIITENKSSIYLENKDSTLTQKNASLIQSRAGQQRDEKIQYKKEGRANFTPLKAMKEGIISVKILGPPSLCQMAQALKIIRHSHLLLLHPLVSVSHF